jgi:hypothetical protein
MVHLGASGGAIAGSVIIGEHAYRLVTIVEHSGVSSGSFRIVIDESSGLHEHVHQHLGRADSHSAHESGIAQSGSSTPLIDVMFVYNNEFKQAVGGTSAHALATLNSWIALINADLSRSLASAQFANIYSYEGLFAGSAGSTLESMAQSSLGRHDGYIDEVFAARDAAGADLVSFVGVAPSNGGSANLGIDAETKHASWLAVEPGNVPAAPLFVSHEFGHNLGCGHGRGDLDDRPVYPPIADFAFAYRAETLAMEEFSTIMDSSSAPGTRIRFFSNPSLEYPEGGHPDAVPIGVDFNVDPNNAADSARAIDITAPIVESYRVSSPNLNDCDSDGYIDAIELFWGSDTDVGGASGLPNGVPDSCDRTEWANNCSSPVADSELVSWSVNLSRELGPSLRERKAAQFYGIPSIDSDLAVTVVVPEALVAASRFVELWINGDHIEDLFVAGLPCFPSPNNETVVVAYQALDLGPEGELILELVPSYESGTVCQTGIQTSVQIEYLTRLDDNLDRDDILDACDPSCNIADNAVPYGVLDFTDINEFLTWHATMDDRADLEVPLGVWDFSDMTLFLNAWNAGCP